MVKCSRKVSTSDFWVSSHDKISDFYASSWQRGESPVPMLVIRSFLSSLAVAILVWSVLERPNLYWQTLLTNWALIQVTMTMLSALLVSSIIPFKGSFGSEKLPWYVATYWLLFNVSSSVTLMITTIYWMLLNEPVTVYHVQHRTNADPEDYQPRLFWLDVMMQRLSSCIMVVEFLVSRTPVRALHFYQPLGVGILYAVLTRNYYAAGGKDLWVMSFPYIYEELLHWREGPLAASTVPGSVTCLLVIYVVLWGAALCRDKVSSAFVRAVSHGHGLAPPAPLDKHSMRIV